MVTGGMLSSVAGWRYPRAGSQRPSAQPLRGGGVSPETLNNEQETTPHGLSLSPYIAHPHACALSRCLPPLSLSLSEFSSRLSLNSCCLNESSLGARTIFIFPARLMPLCLPDYPQLHLTSSVWPPHRDSKLNSGCSFRYYCNSNSDPFLFFVLLDQQHLLGSVCCS